MLTRRIATGVCALCLAIPSAAGASDGTPTGARGPNGMLPAGPGSTVKAKGPYGIVPAGRPSTVKAKGPYGIVPAGRPSTVKAKGPYGIIPAGRPSTVKAKGPYGIIPAGPRSTVKARGPYGIPVGTISQNTTGASLHGRAASSRDDTNGWRTAAISEAALLATVLLGFALLLPARRRPADMVT